MAEEKDNKKSPPRAPQAPSNLPVVNELSEGNKVAVMQEKGISGLNITMDKLFQASVQGTQIMIDHLADILNIQKSQYELSQQINREAYERWLEEQRGKETNKAPEASTGQDQESSGLGLGFLGGLAIVFGALAAEMSGFDKAIRALQLPGVFKSAKETFGSIAKFFGKEGTLAKVVDNFGRGDDYLKLVDKLQANIYRMFGLGIDGKPIVMRDLDTGLFRRATMFFENIGMVLDQEVKYMIGAIQDALKLKPSDLELFMRPVTAVKNFMTSIDTGLVNMFPETMASIKTGFSTFKSFIPTSFADVGKGIDSAFVGIKTFMGDVGKFVGDLFDKLKPIFGSAEEGTGIIGFFSKTFGFMKPLLKPFEFLLKTVLRPFTQILFTIVDFVVGFYDGFTQGEGGFMSKIASGIEGGILGVIKGITDAIDLLLISIPAWFLEKLGFENVAKDLKEFSVTELFMDIYDSIKTFFKNLFSGENSAIESLSKGFSDTGDMIMNIIRSILPKPTDFDITDRSTWKGGLIPDAVYEWAGMDPKTGEVVQKQVEPTDTGTGAGGAAGAKIAVAEQEKEIAAMMSNVDNSKVAVTTVNNGGSKQVTYVNKTWSGPMPLKASTVGMDY